MQKYSALIVTVVILAGSAFYTQQYFIESSAGRSVVVATTTPTHSAPTERVATVAVSNSADTPEITPDISTVPGAAAEIPNAIFSVSGTSYGVYAPPGSTVLAAMQTLASTTDFTFTGREYSGMGYFVESISGKKAADGYVWIFYMNGIKSGKGISSVVVNEGDTIEWKYEKSY